jgi:hypothetical protein
MKTYRMGSPALKFSSIVLAFALVAGGCGTEEQSKDLTKSDSFTLVQHDDNTLEASLVEGDASLRVLIVEPESGKAEATFDFGDPVVTLAVDYNRGVGEFIPSDNALLDAAQSRLVDMYLEGISKRIELNPDEQSRVESAAIRCGSLMQIVPSGETLAKYQFKSARGWKHLPCTCGWRNIGGSHTYLCGRGCSCTTGSTGCRGRCGQGCGGTSTPPCVGTTVYTVDCARHDYGIGSFAAAADDYLLASNNCNCGGNCY